MGTIVARPRRDGSIGYTAQIRIRRDGVIAHNETKTFDRRPAAVKWLERREKDLERDGLGQGKQDDPKLAAVIDRYIADVGEAKIGRTKAQVLRTIKAHGLADLACSSIASHHIVDFAKGLDVQPQTVGNYLSHLASIFAIARPAWGYPLDQQAMKDAFAVAKRLGLTSKSKKRDRRPTLDELDRIMCHFVERQERRPDAAPMPLIIAFAIFSTRRQEEITRLDRADLEPGRVLVRSMKHPGQKIGNDVWCDLTPEAERIIAATPGEGIIFPYGTDAISAAFTRACQFLKIEDLHFHDLRHEGVSRLFEMGWTLPRVASVSGHRSWSSLQRYTQFRQVGDKFAGWPWLARITRRISIDDQSL